jgi:hypothetical protein
MRVRSLPRLGLGDDAAGVGRQRAHLVDLGIEAAADGIASRGFTGGSSLMVASICAASSGKRRRRRFESS